MMKPVIVMTQTSKVQSDLVNIIHKPLIQIQGLSFNEHLLNHSYDWLIFSSKNAVKYFYAYLKSVKVKKVAVIGAKTAQYCQDLNIHVDFLPQDFSQEGFLAEFQNKDQKILLPSSQYARPKLANQLNKYNDVTKIDLYRPVAHQQHIEEVKQLVKEKHIDAITFSSSSAVRFYFSDNNIPEFNHYYAIGKQTADTLKEYHQNVRIADQQTSESLIDKILESRDNNEI